MGTIVLKSWRVKKEPDNKGYFIAINGREGGLIAWFLALVKIDPTTTLKVNMNRVEFIVASLAGTDNRLIPLTNISSTYYGYHKPWKIALGIIFLFVAIASGAAQSGGFLAGLLTFLLGVIISLVYYFLNRSLTIGIVEISGVVSGIAFKRSIIENIDVDEKQAKFACDLIQALIERKQQMKNSVSA
jgi:hypothetical protein